MDAMSLVLNEVFEKIFLECYHGFWKGCGAHSFFTQMRKWGEVEQLIQADIVSCFENLDHSLLLQALNQIAFLQSYSCFPYHRYQWERGKKRLLRHWQKRNTARLLSITCLNKRLFASIRYEKHSVFRESPEKKRYADDLLLAIKRNSRINSSFSLQWMSWIEEE